MSPNVPAGHKRDTLPSGQYVPETTNHQRLAIIHLPSIINHHQSSSITITNHRSFTSNQSFNHHSSVIDQQQKYLVDS
jgi:hypothetical protein